MNITVPASALNLYAIACFLRQTTNDWYYYSSSVPDQLLSLQAEPSCLLESTTSVS